MPIGFNERVDGNLRGVGLWAAACHDQHELDDSLAFLIKHLLGVDDYAGFPRVRIEAVLYRIDGLFHLHAGGLILRVRKRLEAVQHLLFQAAGCIECEADNDRVMVG